MSKHPVDWGIHFCLCWLYIHFGMKAIRPEWFLFIIVTCLFVSVMVEIEQKTQVGTNRLNWKEYFWKHSFGDLMADILGVLAGVLI